MKHVLPVLLLILIGLFLIIAPDVGAIESVGWINALPEVRLSDAPATYGDTFPVSRPCTNETVTVGGYGSGQVCVTHMSGWRYGSFTHDYMANTMMTSETFFVVGLGSDSRMYRVDGIGSDTSIHSGGGNTIIVHACCKILGGDEYEVYPDFPSYLERTLDGYRISDKSPVIAHFDGDEAVRGLGIGISPDGRYAAAQTMNGVALITTATGQARMISPLIPKTDVGVPAQMEFAVSNDGATVFVGGRIQTGRLFSVIDTSGGCGSETSELAVVQSCPARDLNQLFTSGTLPSGYPTNLRINPDGERLDIVLDRMTDGYTRAALFLSDHMPPAVQYFALGDSYSSGEGDTGRDANGLKYYEAHTDDNGSNTTPTEKCHLSTRSYPFLLSLDADFTSSQFHSIACSGAETKDVVADDQYMGQGDRLAGLTDAARSGYDAAALEDIIPGRLPQSAFVEHYLPKAASISVGGNDLQFSTIVADCVYSLTTCSYAADPGERTELGSAIKGMYTKLTDVYSELVAENPGMKLYVVGYPRFINADKLLCPLSTNLDLQERQMIDTSTRYLNQVIEAAAKSAGVKYVNIEDALANHKVCDDPGGYVNAINPLGQEQKETFHPNADGHIAIAAAIEHQLGTADLAAYEYCADTYPCPAQTDAPAIPSYFTDGTEEPMGVAIPVEILSANPVVSGITYIFKIFGLAPLSSFRIELHSDSQLLGTFTTDENGQAVGSITILAGSEPGVHTLHLYGTTPSGEAIDEYQVVDIQAPDTASSTAALSSLGNATPSDPISTRSASSQPTVTSVRAVSAALPATRGNLLILGASIVSIITGVTLVVVGRCLGRPRHQN